MLRGVYTERSECAQHDRAIHQPHYRHWREFYLPSSLQHLMSFSEFDACSPTLAIARFKQCKRRILTPKKHVHNKPIAVLKNTAQTERYVGTIQSFIEKVSNSDVFSSRIGSTTCKRKSMKCLTTSIQGGGGFRLGLLRRDRCHATLHASFIRQQSPFSPPAAGGGARKKTLIVTLTF